MKYVAQHGSPFQVATGPARRPSKVVGGLVMLAAGVTLLAGCGSSGTSGSASPTGPTITAAPVATTATAGGTTPATTTAPTPPTSASTAGAGGAPCLVGSWVSTGETEHGASVGGAGQTFVFASDGTGSQSYDNSAPLVNMTWKGTANGRYTLTPDSPTATSGTINLSYVAGNVTADGTAIQLAPATFNWTCQKDTAVLSVTNAAGVVAVTLQRH